MKNKLILISLLILNSLCFAQKQDDEPYSYKDDLTFAWQHDSSTLKFTAQNQTLAPIEVIFYSRANDKELKSFLLKPSDSIVFLNYTGKKVDSVFRQEFSDSVRLAYFIGHKSVIEPDLEFQYRLPFKEGKKYEVSQSFNGKASHNSTRSKYAIDFQLNVGEPVYAARGGLVIKVIDWFTKQGGRELINAANKIMVLHDDGTIASYVHLDYHGSFVKEGDTVSMGDKIGLSGLTGFTRGPHLHFVVRKERDIAIPVYFQGYEGEELKQGKRYKIKD